jgi:hypothetical protein
MQALWTSAILVLPLVVSGTLHMTIVRLGWLKILDHPIHLRAFGSNKTWRGLVVMPVLTMLAMAMLRGAEVFRDTPWALLGLALGLAYVLFELPNSFIKRRLGVPPGKNPSQGRLFFLAADRLDSLLGCVVVYSWFLPGRFAPIALMFVVGPVIQTLTTLGLYALGLRREPL